MTEPIGKRADESDITVVFVNQMGAVVGSCWVYCETERLKEPEFVEYLLIDSLNRHGPSAFSNACATYVPGLVSDGEACVYLHSQGRKHRLFNHAGEIYQMEAGGQPQLEKLDGSTGQ